MDGRPRGPYLIISKLCRIGDGDVMFTRDHRISTLMMVEPLDLLWKRMVEWCVDSSISYRSLFFLQQYSNRKEENEEGTYECIGQSGKLAAACGPREWALGFALAAVTNAAPAKVTRRRRKTLTNTTHGKTARVYNQDNDCSRRLEISMQFLTMCPLHRIQISRKISPLPCRAHSRLFLWYPPRLA